MTLNRPQTVRLEFTSSFDMVDFVQVVSDHIARDLGLDEDALHWIGVAVRESVTNAIRHGNHNDITKHVVVEFATRPVPQGHELLIRVRDQGEGFDPAELADPLAAENLLKPNGRGIFLIRNLMDAVQLHRSPEGGMEICMTKRVLRSGTTRDTVQA
jgi:serine/threonine-protein kinase RsbW